MIIRNSTAVLVAATLLFLLVVAASATADFIDVELSIEEFDDDGVENDLEIYVYRTDDEPAEGAEIEIDEKYVGDTDEDGAFFLHDLSKGDHIVHIHYEDGGNKYNTELRFEIENASDDDDKEFLIEFEKYQSKTDPYLYDIEIIAYLDDEPAQYVDIWFSDFYEGHTNKHGKLVVYDTSIPWIIEAEYEDGDDWYYDYIQFYEGRDMEYIKVWGEVVDDEGDPIEDAFVDVFTEWTEDMNHTDEYGEFYVEVGPDWADGMWVIANASGYDNHAIYYPEIVDELWIELWPSEDDTYIDGHIMDWWTEEPIENALVELYPYTDWDSYELETGDDGYFAIDLEGDDYWVMFESWNHTDLEFDLYLENGTGWTFEIYMDHKEIFLEAWMDYNSSYTLWVQAFLEWEPLEGVPIYIDDLKAGMTDEDGLIEINLNGFGDEAFVISTYLDTDSFAGLTTDDLQAHLMFDPEEEAEFFEIEEFEYAGGVIEWEYLPGDEVWFSVNLWNKHGQESDFEFFLEDGTFGMLENDTLWLEGYEKALAEIGLKLDEDLRPGEYTVNIEVDRAGIVEKVPVNINVKAPNIDMAFDFGEGFISTSSGEKIKLGAWDDEDSSDGKPGSARSEAREIDTSYSMTVKNTGQLNETFIFLADSGYVTITPSTLRLSPGQSSDVDVSVNVGKGDYDQLAGDTLDFDIAVSTNRTQTVFQNLSFQVETEDLGYSGSSSVPTPFYKTPWFGVIIGLSLALFGFVLMGGEVALLAFIIMLLPLYARISGEKILDNEIRGMIRGYIIANPGDHYSSIKRNLDLKNGTLAYHLRVLEREGIVRSTREGRFRRFYIVGQPVEKPTGIPQLSPFQNKLLRLIERDPGLTQKDICRTTRKKQQLINYHIHKLRDLGFITLKRSGRETLIHPVEAKEPFSYCPYCEAKLELPKTPKICPYCGERLNQEPDGPEGDF